MDETLGHKEADRTETERAGRKTRKRKEEKVT